MDRMDDRIGLVRSRSAGAAPIGKPDNTALVIGKLFRAEWVPGCKFPPGGTKNPLFRRENSGGGLSAPPIGTIRAPLPGTEPFDSISQPPISFLTLVAV